MTGCSSAEVPSGGGVKTTTESGSKLGGGCPSVSPRGTIQAIVDGRVGRRFTTGAHVILLQR